MRYKFYEGENGKMVCVTSFAGKAVRGIAKCSENDTYNSEYGKLLAQTRADIKVAQKRLLRAQERVEMANCMITAGHQLLDNAVSYATDSERQLNEYKTKLYNLLKPATN